jgi:hypothetical protein
VKVEALSRDFIRTWRRRVGTELSVEKVNKILQGAKRITPQRRLFQGHRLEGLRPWKLLAEYWNHGAGLIIRVDEDSQKAVNVFSAWKRRRMC